MKKPQSHLDILKINKAFLRFEEHPKKVAYFDLRRGSTGALYSFEQYENVIYSAAIVIKRGDAPAEIIKIEDPFQGNFSRLGVIICPAKRECAIYFKTSDQREYVDYFHPECCRNTLLLCIFKLRDGVYGIHFDSETFHSFDYGFSRLIIDRPNPFDVISMGLTPTF